MVGNKNLTDVAKPSEIVQLLLNDDQLGDLKASSPTELPASANDKSNGPGMDLWDEEGDDFFGHTVSNAAISELPTPTEEPVASGSRGKKRKPSTRGRKLGGRKNTDLAK